MFETIVITTFISVWTIERIYFYYYNKTNDDAILNLNTGVIPTHINNSNKVNSLNVPLANSENAYYYTAPVYNLPNNENINEHNNENINQNNEKQNNTINI